MLLVIDVGNTNTVVGLYDGEILLHDWRIRTVIHHTVDEYGALILNLLKNCGITAKSVQSIIISCVVPPMLNILDPLCQKYFDIEPIIVGPGENRDADLLRQPPRGRGGPDRQCRSGLREVSTRDDHR
jgi:type III pantothenate kinase